MKSCTYCGRENEEADAACRACGSEFLTAESASAAPTLSRRDRWILVIGVLFIVAIAVIAMPTLLLAVPLLAFFYLPIHLPFLLSLFIRTREWRGMRWSLRVGSVLAVFIRLSGVSSPVDFGDDVAGNAAGAIHNFVWTWGSGAGCALAAAIVGLLLRAVLPSRPRATPEQVLHT